LRYSVTRCLVYFMLHSIANNAVHKFYLRFGEGIGILVSPSSVADLDMGFLGGCRRFRLRVYGAVEGYQSVLSRECPCDG
jgi:hypothetical protein